MALKIKLFGSFIRCHYFDYLDDLRIFELRRVNLNYFF